MIVTGYGLVTVGSIIATSADAQQIITPPTAEPTPTAEDYLANARRMVVRRTVADCLADAAAAGGGEIVVCGRIRHDGLPVPELFGPVAGSSDGAAVDPRGEPCGASISGHCYTGVDLPQLLGAAVGVIGVILDPDKNLGEGTPIPERFRGANR